ncbi:MAG: 3-oxoacyl-[acyl-carrier-protein] reductase [Candidatus Puniceispirillales bacterium]
MFELSDKVALITGASGGIGMSIVKKMKQCGAKLIISGTRQNVLNDLASELGNDVKTIITDLNNKDDVLNLAKKAEASYGHIDILINNAGITADNLFLRMKDDEWDQVINVNLSAPMRLTRQVIKGMLKRRYGRVIFISSVVGYSGNAGQSNYAASKSALVGFTKSIALEVASRGITCNLIAPGFISTPMTDKLSDDQKKNIVENIPVNRLGKVDDISNGCVYLASDEAGFITGTTLHINGGMSMI